MARHPVGTGRTAVVAGARGGLGEAIADRLAARGCAVVRASSQGVDRVLDVRDAAACRSLAHDVQPDIWVNNAGVLGAGNAATQPDEEIDRVVAVNLLGVIHGTRAAFEVMRDRGGDILTVASLGSWVPAPGEAVYAATKAAVLSYTTAFAMEQHRSPVRFHVLCPDGIWTPMLQDRLDDPAAALSFTARRLLSAEQVAEEAMALLDSGRLVRSVPRAKSGWVRLLGDAPDLALRVAPLFEAVGRRNQARARRRILGRGGPPVRRD